MNTAHAKIAREDVVKLSATDPLSEADLRALAQRSRTETLNKNDRWELDRALNQHGAFKNELQRIINGE